MITLGQWLDSWGNSDSGKVADKHEMAVHDMLKDIVNQNLLSYGFHWNRDIIKKDLSQIRLTDPETKNVFCIDYYDNGQIYIWHSLRDRNLNLSLMRTSRMKKAMRFINQWNDNYRTCSFADVRWDSKRDYTDELNRTFTEYTKRTWRHTIKLVTVRNTREKACQLIVDNDPKSRIFREFDETAILWMANTYLRKNYGINLIKNTPDVI